MDTLAQILNKVGNHYGAIYEKLKALFMLADIFALKIVCICPLMTTIIYVVGPSNEEKGSDELKF